MVRGPRRLLLALVCTTAMVGCDHAARTTAPPSTLELRADGSTAPSDSSGGSDTTSHPPIQHPTQPWY